MVKSGLINHGWTYINVDDFWQVNPGVVPSLEAGVDHSIDANWPRKASRRFRANCAAMPAAPRRL
jgi:hypothetical protein